MMLDKKQIRVIFLFFSSVQSLSHVQLFDTPWTAAHQASLSITSSWSLLKLMSIESVMPSNQLILCHPLLLLPSILPSIRVFSKARGCCRSQRHIEGGHEALTARNPGDIPSWGLCCTPFWLPDQGSGAPKHPMPLVLSAPLTVTPYCPAMGPKALLPRLLGPTNNRGHL